MTRPTRRALIAVGAVLALVVLLLVLVPLLFGGRIANRVKAEVNQSLNAQVDWRDASLGIFRDFPNLTLRLDDLTVVGVGAFDGDTLAAMRQLRVILDLPSAVRSGLGGSGPIVVRAVELDRPRVSLIALEDGTANWDITKESADTAAGRPLDISLKRLAIDSGVVTLDNRAARMQASLVGLNQTLSGDFGSERFDMETHATVDATTMDFAGIRYLNRVRLDLTADVAADLAEKTFTLKEGTGLRLNELLLAASGSIAQTGDRLRLDLDFAAPTTNFRDILSLVPAVYAEDFESVRTTGTINVSGEVNGEYGEDAFPAFSLVAKVDSGAFQYPDLPLPARDIFLDLAVSNPGGDADSTVVNLSRLHLVLGRNPINARLVMRTPISDPDLDAQVTGRLDLADLGRTVKLDGVQELSGRIAADAAVRTRMSWVDTGQYDRVAASGTITVADLRVASEALRQPLAISEASLALAPRRAELRSFNATVGSSDISATGSIENFLGYALRDEDLRGTATIASRKFVLDEWRSDEGDLSTIPVPPGIDFALQASVDELLYDKITMTNARGRLRVKDQRITLEEFAVNTMGGVITVDGFYETTTPAKPTFDVGLRIFQLDIPQAFASLATVQALAPVARYAQGSFSTNLRLTGPLSENMMPVFAALTGQGTLQTSQLAIQDFPVFERLAGSTKLSFLEDPTLRAITSQFEIRDGRLHVQPFTVGFGQALMNVSGSNGIDRSLNYDLQLQVPRELIGSAASQALSGVLSRAASAGIDLQTAPQIALAAKVTGTVTDPAISLDLGSAAGSVAETAEEAVREAAEERVDAAVDSVRQRAAAEAERLVREAEERAEGIRAEARALSERVKREGYERADSLVARADNPLERAAANAAAARLREEADESAARIVREGDARANALVSEARQRSGTPAPAAAGDSAR
jgi:uncharacterized protein involved in outer membrane biogenesis